MTHDEWRLLGYGLVTACLMVVVLLPILIYKPNFPKLGAEAILGAVAVAVFLLSKHMERRKKSR